MYIAVDLKVIEGLAASVARASGSTEDAILAGLTRVWHRCWVSGSDRLTTGQLAGLFTGPNPTPGLLEFGFLEAVEGGAFRVRGAARYLRLKESRRAGALATNERRSKSAPKRRSRATVSDAQATLNDALPPSTEHRDIKKEPASQAQAQMKATTDRLVATFKEATGSVYDFAGGRDGTAVAALLKANSPEEIDRRWRIALAHKGFPTVTNLGELRYHWNHFVVGTKPYDPPMRRV